MPVPLSTVLEVLDRAYPARLTEDWDGGVGLTCGDPADDVSSVLLAVDVDEQTVEEAIELGVQLLITHHPLLFRPVQSVAATSAKGGLIHRLVRAGIGHLAAHTNADRAVGGVNDALAHALGLTEIRPLVPTLGEMESGLGRVGVLAQEMSLAEFAEWVAQRLPATVGGVRAGGDPARWIRTVAVCGGAGDGELAAATASGAEVYVTSDLRHHVAAEHLADPSRPALVEVAHWAGEWPWLQRAADVIERELPGSVATTVSRLRTDPWTIHCPSPSGEG